MSGQIVLGTKSARALHVHQSRYQEAGKLDEQLALGIRCFLTGALAPRSAEPTLAAVLASGPDSTATAQALSAAPGGKLAWPKKTLSGLIRFLPEALQSPRRSSASRSIPAAFVYAESWASLSLKELARRQVVRLFGIDFRSKEGVAPALERMTPACLVK